MTDIYRYLISKDPTLLTTEGALSVFKLNDEDLNEEIIRILQANQSPVLFVLHRIILGNEAIHTTFANSLYRGEWVGSGQTAISYITGEKMNMKSHYKEWYNFAKLDKVSVLCMNQLL